MTQLLVIESHPLTMHIDPLQINHRKMTAPAVVYGYSCPQLHPVAFDNKRNTIKIGRSNNLLRRMG